MTNGKPYFFVGIGGSGMMPLAMILAGGGARVAGSDRALDPKLYGGALPAKFADLAARGVTLFAQDGSGVISAEQIVVASAAVEASVADIVAAEGVGALRMSRAELLADLFNASALPIGVAGTSGKSTVTGMIGWILHAAGRDPTVMNGAVMKNFATLDAPFASALVSASPASDGAFVSEVDESDGSIVLYRPKIAVLNNVSLDHKSLEELRALFGAFARKAETTILNIGDAETAALATALDPARLVTVAVEADADLSARNLRPEPFAICFDLVADGAIHPVRLAVPGRHNVSNGLAALGAARAAGVPLDQAINALTAFTGLKRRFDLVGEACGVTVIDDFGHNPDKIAATLATLHAFPGRLLVLFQPHGYGPLKVMRRDLIEMFARDLAPGDLLVMPDPVYQGGTVARDVTSADIVNAVASAGAEAYHIANRAEAAAWMVAQARCGDRIVVMGARDDTLSELAADMLPQIAARLA